MMIQSPGDMANGEADPSRMRNPTIGFLTESLSSLYQTNIWMGASDAANRLGYSLICFAGGSLTTSSWNEFEKQRNAVYDFIDKKGLRGIIIAGSLGNFISAGEFREFYHNFIDIPLVCLGPEIPSVPTVIVDNSHGMRELISHLVEFHQCRRIAFIRGPEGNQEAEKRLNIFHEVLSGHGITPDPDLIISGDFSRDAGEAAVFHLLDNEFQFDALVGANDDTALGALKAFQERHVRVPDEVLVAGFDDIEESGFSAPPLTTVRQPLYEMGGKAVEVIHDLIKGKAVEGTIVVPATLVTRQSCGCFRHQQIDEKFFAAVTGEDILTAQRERLRHEIETTIRHILPKDSTAVATSQINNCVDTFIAELNGVAAERFVPELNKITWTVATSGGDAMGMFQTLIILRQFARVFCGSPLPPGVETLFQNIGVAIADSATRAQAFRRLAAERRATILRSAGEAIASAFDLDGLLSVIACELVRLDIDGCWLSLYENEADPSKPSQSLRCVLALHEGQRIPTIPPQAVFSAPQPLPDGIGVESADCRSMLLEPLFFREQQIGIILFDIRRCRDGETYEILQRHISSALKGALLMKKVREQATALEIANQQLRKLRDAEHAYLKAIKHELELGREIQMSFLPRTIPAVKGWEIVVAFQPAREVSGDFYDIFTLPDNKLAMVICDVSGKDVSAALFMSLIRTLIRAFAEQALSGASEPLDAVGLTNRYLINHHSGGNGRYMYATLFMAVLDPSTGDVSYVNAGHNPAAIITDKGDIREWNGTTGPAVGIIPEAIFGKKRCTLAPGDMIYLYTDGITEARGPDGTLFSKERLTKLLSIPAPNAQELIGRISRNVEEHNAGNPPSDDITMVVARRSQG